MKDNKYLKEDLSHEGADLENGESESGTSVKKPDKILTKNVIVLIIASIALLLIGGTIAAAYIFKGDTKSDERSYDEDVSEVNSGEGDRENEDNEETASEEDDDSNSDVDEDNEDDSYEGWQVYSSEIYPGLTVRYPEGWVLEEEVVYDLDGFVFRFTNGDITWEMQPEYLGQFSETPNIEVGSNALTEFCFGIVINFNVPDKYDTTGTEFDEYAYEFLDDSLKCQGSNMVIVYSKSNMNSDLSLEDYETLNMITESMEKTVK